MVERVARYGSEERFAARAPVFSRGDRSVDFFVVLEGSIEIFDSTSTASRRSSSSLRARQFTGELDLFNERQVLVSGARRRGDAASCASSAPTSAAWSRASPTSARSSCAPSSCAASA